VFISVRMYVCMYDLRKQTEHASPGSQVRFLKKNVCVCVCVCVRVCIYFCMYMYVCMYVCMYVAFED
jgi:hypothetical protein